MAVQLFANNVFTILQAAIVAGSGTITVPTSDAAKFPTPTAGDWFLITVEDNVNLEIMRVTARAAEVLTVTRAQESTIATSFPAGSRVDMRMTAGSLTNFLQAPALANYVLGPASSLDNALVRWDLATGKLVQNSNATLDDTGNLVLAGALTAGNTSVATFSTSSTTTLSPASANVAISPTGTGTVTINPAVAGAIERMNIGASVRGTGAFTTLAASGTSTLGVVNAGTLNTTGANVFTNTGVALQLVSTDPGAVGPTFDMYHNSASPAVSDTTAVFTLSFNSSTGVKRTVFQLNTVVTNATNTAESVDTYFSSIKAGALVTAMHLSGTSIVADGLIDASGAGASQIKFGNANNSANVDTLDGYKDYVASTPTLVGFGAPTGIVYFSKRVGDRLEGYFKFTSGTSTAVEARLPLLLNGVALTADATKIPSIMLCGCMVPSVASTPSFYLLVESSVTYMTFSQQQTGAAGLTKQNGSATAAAATIVSGFFSVPISGW